MRDRDTKYRCLNKTRHKKPPHENDVLRKQFETKSELVASVINGSD